MPRSIEISDLALDRVARAGEGSVRDSLSLLERAMAFCGSTIGDEDVLRMLGAVRATVLVDLMRALSQRDAGAMLQVLDGLIDEGHDLLHFWTALIGALRDLLLLRAWPEAGEMLSLPRDDAAALAEAAKELSQEDLTRVFGVIADLEPGLKSSGQPRFLFEAALIRLAGLGAVRPIEEFLQALDGKAQGVAAPARAPQKKKPAETAAAPVAAAPASPPSAEPPPPAATAPALPTPPAASPPPLAPDVAAIVAAVHEARPMIGAMLAEATLSLNDGELHIRFAPGMEAIRRQVDNREGIALVRGEAEKLAGGPVRVTIETGDGPEPTPSRPPAPPADVPRAAAPAEAPSPPPAAPEARPAPARPAASPERESPSRPDPAPPGVDAHGLLETARKEPGVRKLLDVFRAHVVDIRQEAAPEDPTQKPGPTGHPEDAP